MNLVVLQEVAITLNYFTEFDFQVMVLALFHVSVVCHQRDAVFTSSAGKSLIMMSLPISSQLPQFSWSLVFLPDFQ
jgi:hypothetical protein